MRTVLTAVFGLVAAVVGGAVAQTPIRDTTCTTVEVGCPAPTETVTVTQRPEPAPTVTVLNNVVVEPGAAQPGDTIVVPVPDVTVRPTVVAQRAPQAVATERVEVPVGVTSFGELLRQPFVVAVIVALIYLTGWAYTRSTRPNPEV